MQQGVARELLEETGLEVQVLDMIEAFDRIFLDPAAANSNDRSRPKYHYVIVDYLCERLAGEAQAGSDVTDIAYATEQELEKFHMTSTATRVLQPRLRHGSRAPQGTLATHAASQYLFHQLQDLDAAVGVCQ